MNILIIMSDQHNLGYLGCAGHQTIETPHLDRLASTGVRFENAYCPSPLCGPARMSFLTGLYPHQTGVYANAQPLPSDIPTFAHALSGAGYATALIGRMHLTGPDRLHGFEEKLCGDVTASTAGGGLHPRTEGLPAGGQPAGLRLSGPGDSAYQHYDDEVTETAAAWIREQSANEDVPFMACVGLALPHNPYVCSAEDYDRYAGRVSLPSSDPEKLQPVIRERHDRETEGVTQEEMLRSLAAYCGSVTATDRRVGRIISALEESGQLEDTLVVYTSDHGDAAAEHGLWHKTTMYEGSAGVPMIMRVPGLDLRGRVETRNVNLIDLAPTLLDYAGVTPLPRIDGRSLRGLVEGDSDEWDNVTFSEYGTRWGRACLMRMVRRDNWKYVYYDDGGESLFDLAEDPGEDCDLASDPSKSAVLCALRSEALRDWDSAEVSRRLDVWSERNAVIFSWMKSRHRDDPELYYPPAGSNRLDLVPDWRAETEKPWEDEIGSY